MDASFEGRRMECVRYARMDASVDTTRKARTRAKSESDEFANLFEPGKKASPEAASNEMSKLLMQGRRTSNAPSIASSRLSSISPRHPMTPRPPASPRHPMDKAINLIDRRRESRDLSPVVDFLRTGHYSCQQFNRSMEGVLVGAPEPRGDTRLRELRRDTLVQLRRDSLKRGLTLLPVQALGALPPVAERGSTVHSHIKMNERMRLDAIAVAKQCLDEVELPIESQIAAEIECAFDELHGPKWRCFVGRCCAYSLNVVHDTGSPHMHFSLGQFPVLLLKL